MQKINKVILITNIPAPYRIQLWDLIKKKFDLKVICIAPTEKNRNWRIEQRDYISFLKSYHLFFERQDWALHFSIPFTLFWRLYKENPMIIVITGYDSIQYWEALFYAKIFNKKIIMWSGSTLYSSRSTNKVIRFLKNYFINSMNGFYTYGTEATKYIKSFGIKENKITTGTNCIDTSYFKSNTSNDSNISNRVNFLYVGQLIERKGLVNTIVSFSRIKYKNWHFTIVGTGSQENELKNLVSELQLEDKITFVGFKQKEEIIRYYSNSDVFIMPSYLEVWGLVLNEALASGLFVLSSKYAGATFDLVEEGINGFTIDPKKISDIILKIEKVISMNFDKKIIKNNFQVTYEKEAKKMLNLIEALGINK